MNTLARALMVYACLSGSLEMPLYGQRARIGLALSGGGARGLAHIGVLEWIERNQIPVDYVAGTSMGGVIGGFYATGLTSLEIRRLITTLDWDKLLTGPPSYDELSMRRKEDRRKYSALLEFGLRGGLRLPRAVNPGQYIGLTIDRVTLPYGTIQSFNELPIPFTAQYLVNHARTAFDAGYILGKTTEIRVGYEIGSLDANVDIGGNGLPDVDGLLHAVSGRFIYNSLDNAMTASRGSRVSAAYSWYLKSPGAPAEFPLAEVSLARYQPVSRSESFGNAAGGTTFKKTAGPAQQFTLGGPLRLSAYGLDEFRGNHYVLASAGYRHRLGVLPSLIGGNIYASLWLERGSAFFRSRDAGYRNDFAAALTLDTLLGPLVFGGAWGEGGKGKVFFSFGRHF